MLNIRNVLVAVLIGVIAVPTAMTGLFQSIDDDGINSITSTIDLRQKALNDAGRVRYLRRNYWRAVDVYNELVRLGYENLIPPEINEVDSIEYYLDPENFTEADLDTVHASAPEEIDAGYLVAVSEAQHEYNMLPPRWRDLIDGSVDSQFCAPTLSKYTVQGQEDTDLHDLCVRLLDERLAAISPNLFQRSAYLRGFNPVGYAPLRNLRNRLKVLEESLMYEDGTSIRPKTHSGNRPRL
ncbi:MAG: hypothetical protein KC680_01200 [Candidatus Peregrinibacteria bacterium]|nr:hypothetical protein [Candidatus Peregrinibacteria bacterium]MCB9808236.1 hypothetical protein [Candidatus Peribacteria bacterium]